MLDSGTSLGSQAALQVPSCFRYFSVAAGSHSVHSAALGPEHSLQVASHADLAHRCTHLCRRWRPHWSRCSAWRAAPARTAWPRGRRLSLPRRWGRTLCTGWGPLPRTRHRPRRSLGSLPAHSLWQILLAGSYWSGLHWARHWLAATCTLLAAQLEQASLSPGRVHPSQWAPQAWHTLATAMWLSSQVAWQVPSVRRLGAAEGT